ncbi:MAG: DUF1643 domain-containing protein [Solirubrobacteraceae bacterium]
MVDVSSALVSADGRFRLDLHRRWGDCSTVMWIMLNPSTADARCDDPTIRRCVSHSRRWGYGGLVVCNLYAIRCTDPRILDSLGDIIGVGNDEHISVLAASSDLILAAWGSKPNRGAYPDRAEFVLDRLRAHDLYAIGTCSNGEPRHPLYSRNDVLPELWCHPISPRDGTLRSNRGLRETAE